jgi:hypothetical protein
MGKRKLASRQQRSGLDLKKKDLILNPKITLIPIYLYPILLVFRLPLNDISTFRAYVASLPLGLLTLVAYRKLMPYFINSKNTYFSFYYALLFFLSFPFKKFLQDDRVNHRSFPSNESQSKKLVSELVTGDLSSNFPHKNLVFILFLGLISFSLLWFHRSHRITDVREIILATLCSLLILLSTWKNTSWASPYSWVPSLEKNKSENYTYVVSHFSNGEGLVNADEFVNSSMLNLFNGDPFENIMLLRRPFNYYLISHLSTFVNPLYLWTTFNLAIWVLGALSTYFLLKILGFGFTARAFSTAFVAVFPLSAAYVGQSAPYLTSTFIPVFITFFFVFFTKQRSMGSISPLILLCIAISLTYDAYFAIFVISLAALRSTELKKSDVSKVIVISFVTPFAYSFYFTRLTDVQIPNANQSPIFSVIKAVFEFLKQPNVEIFQTNILASSANSLFVLLSLLTPLIFFFYASVSIYLFYIDRRFQNFSRELIAFALIGFFVFQSMFTLANQRHIGTIPRVNSLLFIVLILLLAEFNKVKHFSLPIFLLSTVVIFYLFLLNLRMVPGWRLIIFNLVEGGWASYNFD